VNRPKSPSTIDAAAAKLRSIVLTTSEGAMLGSEETLIARLGVSRATVRQVARLLEREGLLRVRRGINGGYFAAQPDLHTIEAAVSGYLEVVHTEPEDVTMIASVLWVEVLRRAAHIRSPASRALAEKFSEKVLAVRLDAPFSDVLAVEQESRTAIFDLINSRYIELIFQINIAFAQRHFAPSSGRDGTDAHRDFVRAWRGAKLIELASIADGDADLAVIAARHVRNLWHRRIWDHARS
jgi:GntR family transcriptional regulator, transcriptional repressor for pyruvate dehydrogenase complex